MIFHNFHGKILKKSPELKTSFKIVSRSLKYAKMVPQTTPNMSKALFIIFL